MKFIYYRTCIPLASSFLCNCAPGWNGNACQTQINECDSNPCLNGATCTDRLNGYTCQCTDSFEGPNCQDEKQGQGNFSFKQSQFLLNIGLGVPLYCLLNCVLLLLECGGYRSSSEGTITFPSTIGGGATGQGMDCAYRIRTTAGKIMNITFGQFRLKGPSYYCSYDWLQVYIY